MKDQKIAIITGAGRGIGRATTISLAQAGYRCVAVSRTREDVEQTATLAGNGAIARVGDVCNAADIDSVVKQAMDQFGRIDAVVNNAGIAPLLPFDQMTDAVWDETLSTNLTSVFRMTRAVWPIMVAQKNGAIVNLSSESSRDPFPGFSAYAAAKAGVNLFTRALAKESVVHNIRVYAVAPAGVETGMLRKIATEDQLPTEQLLIPQQVARVICSCIKGDLPANGETIYIHRQ